MLEGKIDKKKGKNRESLGWKKSIEEEKLEPERPGRGNKEEQRERKKDWRYWKGSEQKVK